MLRLTIAYDGTDFHGFAAQPDHRTVQGELEGALGTSAAAAMALSCAQVGPTPACRWGQVALGAVDRRRPRRGAAPAQLPAGTRGRGAPGPAGRPGFDARHSAMWRAYRFTIVNREAPDPFLARTAWWVPEPSTCRSCSLGPFLGEHDFASFCRRGPRGRRPCGGCSTRRGSISATACCATRSPPLRSAGRWCGRSSARSSTSAPAGSSPATCSASCARDRRCRVGAAAGAVSLGRRLLTGRDSWVGVVACGERTAAAGTVTWPYGHIDADAVHPRRDVRRRGQRRCALPRLSRARDRRPARSVPPTRRRRGATRRALGAPAAARRRRAATAPAVPRARSCLLRATSAPRRCCP